MVIKSIKVGISGSSGFVGKTLMSRLTSLTPLKNIELLAWVRTIPLDLIDGVKYEILNILSPNVDLYKTLANVDVIIHTAARVHVMSDNSKEPLTEFRRVNVQGTLNLARQAAAVGVRRFIFISSIKVNGESTQLGLPFHADDVPAPQDAYGISKMEAEQGLRALSVETGMEMVIIRPPLVYGPGVKANFAAMMRWLSRRIPLPLGAIHNKRSLVALDNLVDLIVTCLTHPAAANQTFLVSDGEDVSTTELLSRMGQAMGKPARLVPVPAGLIKVVAKLLGKGDVAQRLCASLQVDIEKTRRLLDWNPPSTLDQGLKKASEGFKP
jgi:UDP-glucose 4-epimerase